MPFLISISYTETNLRIQPPTQLRPLHRQIRPALVEPHREQISESQIDALSFSPNWPSTASRHNNFVRTTNRTFVLVSSRYVPPSNWLQRTKFSSRAQKKCRLNLNCLRRRANRVNNWTRLCQKQLNVFVKETIIFAYGYFSCFRIRSGQRMPFTKRTYTRMVPKDNNNKNWRVTFGPKWAWVWGTLLIFSVFAPRFCCLFRSARWTCMRAWMDMMVKYIYYLLERLTIFAVSLLGFSWLFLIKM